MGKSTTSAPFSTAMETTTATDTRTDRDSVNQNNIEQGNQVSNDYLLDKNNTN